MAENPARHFRFDHVKGALTIGRDADIVVLTPEPFVYDAAASGNNVVGWSPYNGLTLPWRVAGDVAARGPGVRGQARARRPRRGPLRTAAGDVSV